MSKGVVLITGGYGRLGLEFARAFTKDGWSVLLTGRDPDKLRAAASEAGTDHHPLDIADEEQVLSTKKHVEERYGVLDVLINNAAVMRSEAVETMAPALFLKSITTNLYGTFLCTHHFLPLLKKSDHALVINVASTSAHRADAGSAAYNASKFGLRGFTEALRKELRKHDIRVTSISPSMIRYQDAPSKGKGVGLNGRDVADAALFLANAPGRSLYIDLEIWATNP
jgi:NAD(P)-dependent dehydrogenase (short-subunit alcohol dehydrogenase family)